MDSRTLTEHIIALRKELFRLRDAITIANRDGDLLRNARLTLQACRVRRRLIEAQARLFE
jgi:hypothetical protein